jgi:hypothetical protein
MQKLLGPVRALGLLKILLLLLRPLTHKRRTDNQGQKVRAGPNTAGAALEDLCGRN